MIIATNRQQRLRAANIASITSGSSARIMTETSTWSSLLVHPKVQPGQPDDRWMVTYPRGLLGATAEPDFHQLLDADSRRLRRRLNEAHTRPQVRMAVRREIRRREELL